MIIDKTEQMLEKLAKDFQCLITRDKSNNIIRLTDAEWTCIMYTRTTKGWQVIEGKKLKIIPFVKGDEKRNIEIIKNYERE